MQRRVDMDRLQELVRLHRMGSGGREVARLLGMSPNTERMYRIALEAAGLLAGPIADLPTLENLTGRRGTLGNGRKSQHPDWFNPAESRSAGQDLAQTLPKTSRRAGVAVVPVRRGGRAREPALAGAPAEGAHRGEADRAGTGRVRPAARCARTLRRRQPVQAGVDRHRTTARRGQDDRGFVAERAARRASRAWSRPSTARRK